MNEYEERIAELEKQLANQQNGDRSVSDIRYNDLMEERNRLARALEVLGDRSVYTKLMYTRQSKGEQIMSLRMAGDVILLSHRQAEETVEELLQERDARQAEL